MATLKTILLLKQEHDLRPSGWSWAALGLSVGGLGALLGPMLPVLGRPQGLCARFCPFFGRLLAVLDRLGPTSGQGLGGEAIWQGIRAEKSPEQLHIRSLPRPTVRSPSQKFIIGFWVGQKTWSKPPPKIWSKTWPKIWAKNLAKNH